MALSKWNGLPVKNKSALVSILQDEFHGRGNRMSTVRLWERALRDGNEIPSGEPVLRQMRLFVDVKAKRRVPNPGDLRDARLRRPASDLQRLPDGPGCVSCQTVSTPDRRDEKKILRPLDRPFEVLSHALGRRRKTSSADVRGAVKRIERPSST